jgi:tetratricopeptide (TPR) repeat protein
MSSPSGNAADRDLAVAAAECEQLLSLDPGNFAALERLSRLRQQQGEFAAAVKLLERMLAVAPTAERFVQLAECQRASHQFEAAEQSARAALQLEENHTAALRNLGLALGARGRKADAIEAFRGAARLEPNSAETWAYLGVMLAESGERQEAESALARSLAIDPNQIHALIALARYLLDAERPAEAAPLLERAIQQRPQVAELHRNLGNALHALGQLSRAREAYRAALNLDPHLTLAQANLAMLLKQQGELERSREWLTRALQAEPTNPVYLHQLARLHEALRAPLEAAAAWEDLARSKPESARAYVVVGLALEKRGQSDAAAAHYREAIRLKPDLAEAFDRLAKTHKDLGEFGRSEEVLRESRRICPTAIGPLSGLAFLLGAKLPHGDFEELARSAQDSRLDPEARAHALFAITHVLDSRGEYARAASWSREANTLRFENRGGQAARTHELSGSSRFVERTLREFDASFFAERKGCGLTSTRPVFVFGLPRSGTTLVEQILASHPEVFGAGELVLAAQTFESVASAVCGIGAPINLVKQLNAGAISRLGAQHLDGLAKFDGGRSPRIVDKLPQNYQLLGFLATLFPKATFIHCRRDLRDVALSCWLTEFDQVDWAQDMEQITARFAQYVRLMRHWSEVLPVKVHDIEYERTVADLEGVARELVAACGLEWDPACLEFHQSRRAVRTNSSMQVRQPIYSRSVGRWKHYEPYLPDLFAHLPIG